MPSAWEMLPGNGMENQHFHYFRSVTTCNLASFFDFGFWSCKILQASHLYPALYHAVTALGSIHRGYISDSTPATVPRVGMNCHVQFALRQFNKSIRSFSKLLSEKTLSLLDQQVALTTCIMFTCLSTLQGRQYEAFMHVNNGLKMLHHWKLNNRALREPGDDVAMDMLVLMFTRLDTQIRPYLLGQEAVLRWTDEQVIPTITNLPFRSLLEAYVDLEVLLNHLMQLLICDQYYLPVLSPEVLLQKEAIIRQFGEWDHWLADFLTAVSPSTPERNALNLLRLRRGFARAMLAWDTTRGEHAHDDLTPIYQDLLGLAAQVLQEADKQSLSLIDTFDEQKPQHPNFVLASIVTEPLFWIGTRCREPTLRRRALRLQQLYPRREGICEGMLGAKIIEKVIEIEETGCPRGINTCRPSSPFPFPSSTSPVFLQGHSNRDTTASPCSEKGRWVCELHRVASYQFILNTERQCKVIMRTVEDLILGRRRSELVSSWW